MVAWLRWQKSACLVSRRSRVRVSLGPLMQKAVLQSLNIVIMLDNNNNNIEKKNSKSYWKKQRFVERRMIGAGKIMLEDESTICEDMLNALDVSGLQAKAAAFNDYNFEAPNRSPLAIDNQRTAILELLKKKCHHC
ncbi:hypothetical protein OUZ56_017227 [Daphnia magna]|uniref:Uncharacterized protein n=1 Tax=Daphnia magna TaxID=35525 RepID=A0ABR0ASG7_9CRUS|nr:hypothetical protein OUZ56_017227 [Daphnia magna]